MSTCLDRQSNQVMASMVSLVPFFLNGKVTLEISVPGQYSQTNNPIKILDAVSPNLNTQ
jgi:hypothetical protein